MKIKILFSWNWFIWFHEFFWSEVWWSPQQWSYRSVVCLHRKCKQRVDRKSSQLKRNGRSPVFCFWIRMEFVRQSHNLQSRKKPTPPALLSWSWTLLHQWLVFVFLSAVDPRSTPWIVYISHTNQIISRPEKLFRILFKISITNACEFSKV